MIDSLLGPQLPVLSKHLPHLRKALESVELAKLEARESPAIGMFRESGGAGALIPAEHGGLGLTAYESVRLTAEIGRLSPSLAVAATMHNFSVAGLVALAKNADNFEWLLLDAVANDRLLMCSAFAEGRSEAGVFSPALRGVRQGDQWSVSGSKKPCSLAADCDIVTASLGLREEDGSDQLGVAVFSAQLPGVSSRPFWGSPLLAGARSDELLLQNVLIDDIAILRPEMVSGSPLDSLQTVGLIWFTILIAGGYLGAAARLVNRLLYTQRGSAHDRARLIRHLQAAASGLDGVAAELDTGISGHPTLGRALLVRYTVESELKLITDLAVELLGGIDFISGFDSQYILAAVRALQFHPPGARSMDEALLIHHFGGDLVVR